MEVWILLFTVFIKSENGDFQASEERVEFPTSDECAKGGTEKLNEATKQGQPATFFCFKKGEKIG